MKPHTLISILFLALLPCFATAQTIPEKLTPIKNLPKLDLPSPDGFGRQMQHLEEQLKKERITSKLISKGKSAVLSELNKQTGIDPSITEIDSTTAVNKVKSIADDHLTEELGISTSSIPTDSSAIASKAKELASDELQHHAGIDGLPSVSLDSASVNQYNEQAQTKAEEYVKKTDEYQALAGQDTELSQLQDTKSEVELSLQELQQLQARRDMKAKMASSAKQYISQHTDKIQQVQNKMTELKQKYSVVPNSQDLSTARKRSSLEGESVWKRLVLGGNFNISSTNPVTVDFSPVVGWRFNKLFEAGVTGAYRAQFGADRTGINTFDDDRVYGYSVFASHMVFKNFFGYLEGENMSKVSGTAENFSRQWHQSLIAGIGRRFKVAKFLEMQAIVGYNFLHDNLGGVYESPVVFKTGFRVVK